MQERTTFFSGCSMARSFISSIVLCCLIALLLLVCSPVFFFAAANISSSMLLRFNNLFELELIWYGGNWWMLLVNWRLIGLIPYMYHVPKHIEALLMLIRSPVLPACGKSVGVTRTCWLVEKIPLIHPSLQRVLVSLHVE